MSRAARGRGGLGSGEWYPVIDSVSILLITVALFTFVYFAVGYRYLEVFFKPGIVMLAMLASGVSMGVTLGGARVRMDFFNLSMVTAGFLAAVGLLGIQFVVNLMQVPAQGLVVELSPFWVILFYLSVGVAEEAVFTLSMFSIMVRAGVNVVVALLAKSAFFVAYHNFVAIQMFSKPIFQVTNYSLALYVGSILLTLAFYYTRHFSVPALGHGLLNAFIQLQVLSGGGV